MSRLSRSLTLGRAFVIVLVVGLLLLFALAWSQSQAIRSGTVSAGHGIDGRAVIDTGKDRQCQPGAECGPGNPATKVAPSPAKGPKVQP
jgi:hypothetical protein